MGLWKIQKLDIWQMRLRVTGSLHTAETKGTDDLPDVSVHLCSDRHEVTRAAELWQPKPGAKKGPCQETNTSLPSVLHRSAAISLLRWQICTPNKCPSTTLFAFHCWTSLWALHPRLRDTATSTCAVNTQYNHPGTQLWAAPQPAILQAFSWTRSLSAHDTCWYRQ